MEKILCFLLFFLLFSASPAISADLKIGVVDIQRVIVESKAGEEARALFVKEVESKKTIVSAKEETLKALENELKTTSITPKQRAEKEERLSREAKDLKRLKDDLEEELRRKDNEIRQRLLRDIVDIVKKTAEEGKYTLIIEKRQGAVYAHDSIDITSKVIEKYNRLRQKK